MSCVNITGNSGRYNPSCPVHTTLFVFRCIFELVSGKTAGGAISVSGGNVLYLSVAYSFFANCSAPTAGCIYAAGISNGAFAYNCFLFDFVTSGQMTTVQTSGEATTVVNFGFNSISKCPNNCEGIYYVAQFENGKIELKNSNCSHCKLSQHTVYHFMDINFLCSFNTVAENGAGVIHRIVGNTGFFNYSNFVSNFIIGTQWTFSHDFSSATALYFRCVFVNNPFKTFSYGGKSTRSESSVFNCAFLSNNVPNTPTEIFINPYICGLFPKTQSRSYQKTLKFHFILFLAQH